MSTFQPSIPIGTNLLSVDYKNIQLNFQQLDTSFSRNHIAFSVTPNNGKHTFLEMPVSAGIPAPVPGLIALEGTIYTKTATESTLFYTPDASGNEYQLTRTITGSFSLFSTFINNYNGVGVDFTGGWTFLPGGLLMQYGLFDAGVGGLAGTGTIKFPVTFTSPANIVQPVLICKAAGTTSTHTVSVISGTVTNSEFQWNLDAATTAQTGIYWTAIGK